MRTTSKFQLYIVQPNDTINSISSKFNIDEFELKRLNPTLRYSLPHAGQPLNIPIEERDSNETSDSSNACILTFYKYFSTQKQVIIAYIYVPEYSKVLQNELAKITQDVVKCVEETLESSDEYDLNTILLELENETLTFIDVIKSKDPQALKKYNAHLDDLLGNFIQLSLTKAKNIDETTIYDIVKKWQLFTLKILARKFDEAEDIYNKLQSTYINLGKNLI